MKLENLYKSQIGSRIGIAKYRVNEVTDEELTPHLLMEKAKAILERRPFVFAGISQRVMFINGSGLYAGLVKDSKNIKGKTWVQTWIDQRKTLLNQARYMSGINWTTQGNVYFEPSFIEGQTAGKKYLNNLGIIPDSSKIYYNTMSVKNADFWLYRVEDEMVQIRYKNKLYAIAEYQPYKYSPSTAYFQTTMKAFKMPKNKLIHLKQPYTLDGYYGFSFVMAAIDDEEAINKIVRNLIIISSNKAVGKKIISVLDEKGRLVSEEDIEEIENRMDLDVGENIVVNKKIDVQDMASTGTYDTMMPEIEYLTKDMISGLTPSYMTPWNQSMSLANAQQARLPFIMSNEAEKKLLEDFWTDMLIPLLNVEAKDKGISLEGVKIEFGETQYYSLEERKDFYMDLYEKNIITYNALLKMLDMEPVENGDIYYRQMEALLDNMYGEAGTDSFEGEKVAANAAISEGVNYENFKKAMKNNIFREALKKKRIPKDDKHIYEHGATEAQTIKKAAKEVQATEDEIMDILNKDLD